MKQRPCRFSISVLWYDCWVGLYWDRKWKALYFCPLPFLVLRFHFGWRCYCEASHRSSDFERCGTMCFHCRRRKDDKTVA